MNPQSTWLGVIVLALSVLFVAPAHAQDQAAKRVGQRFKTIAEILDRSVPVKRFMKPMSLKELLGALDDSLKSEITVLLDWKSFHNRDPDEYPDPEALQNVQIKLLEVVEQRNQNRDQQMKAALILKMALRQLKTSSSATYLIRRGHVEITLFETAQPEVLLGQRVSAHFEKRPLDEALEELSDQTGATILVDERLGDKAKTPVTATFRNTASLETAARLLAEMADLRVELEDSILFVTAKPKADPAPRKSELHLQNRWVDLALRDLARWSGRTIVLDPHVRIRHTTPEGDVRLILEGPVQGKAHVHKVTARFTPDVSIEAAARIIADQVDLAVVALDNALYVTTRSNAERLRGNPAVVSKERPDVAPKK